MWEFCEACLAIHLCHAHVNHWSGSKPTNRNRWSVKSSSPPDDPKHLSYVSDMDLKRLYGTYPSVSAIVWKTFVSACLYRVSEPVTETSPIAYACWTQPGGLWNIALKRRGTKYDSYCAQYKHLAKEQTSLTVHACLLLYWLTGPCENSWRCASLLKGVLEPCLLPEHPPLKCFPHRGFSARSPADWSTKEGPHGRALWKSWKFERILAYTGVELKGVSSITSSISVVWECVCTIGVHWFYWPPENMTLFALQAVKGRGWGGGSLLTPAHLSWHSIP